ncbi:MAG: hypothetical protein IMX04_00290 [Candidatus Carbobacillus altaicus]|nr:hypothetical protein [Candidatus Carbobacillus altaicus]
MIIFNRSHAGWVRAQNEDYLDFLSLGEGYELIVVADGMGTFHRSVIAHAIGHTDQPGVLPERKSRHIFILCAYPAGVGSVKNNQTSSLPYPAKSQSGAFSVIRRTELMRVRSCFALSWTNKLLGDITAVLTLGDDNPFFPSTRLKFSICSGGGRNDVQHVIDGMRFT